MRKTIISLLMISVLLVSVGFVMAVKPAGNLGAQKVSWYLSADVMPVPPYGSRDIPGSDTASKLIVNQPNGATEVTITGAMNGLDSNTEYTVYLSKGYTLNKKWSVTGTWVIAVNNGAYIHDYTFTMTSLPDGTFTGIGGYPAGSDPYTYDEIVTEGEIVGDTISFTATYQNGYVWHATGKINSGGELVEGRGDSGVSEWHSTSGVATYTMMGSGWSGLFTSTVQPFTFTTDDYGAGSWHLNLRDSDFLGGLNNYKLSVWINRGGTMLISDNFDVVVD